MSFDTNAKALLQEHFSILEIDLPAFSSGQSCTWDSGTGFYTPLTCDETWDGTTFKTYYFATSNTPLEFGRPRTSSGLPGDVIEIHEPIHRIMQTVRETVTELRPGEGLALLGIVQATLVDKLGDPGPVDTTENGTFLGKFNARNIIANKEIRKKDFHVNNTGVYAESDARVTYYVGDSFFNNGNGTWTIKGKDELTRIEKDKTQFPEPTGGTLRSDINDSTTTIPVDSNTDWNQKSTPYTIRIGEELMKVTSVANNQTASATLTVFGRGVAIVFTNTLSTTVAAEHNAGDDVQICYTSDNQDIDDFLTDVIEAAGIPSARIPSADWAAEIAEWHSSDKINMIWHDPKGSNDVIKKVCNDFLLDIWFDAVDREIKLSAISVWQTEGPTLEQGKQINRDTFKITPKEDMRFSRAFVLFNKPNKVLNDDVENYRELSLNINSTPEQAGLYDETKSKQFDPSPILSTNAAALLTQRYAARFGFTPEMYSWTTEERFLNFATGDIGTFLTKEKQGADGNPEEIRAQIVSVQPVYNNNGRSYRCKALTFEPAFSDGTDFTITADQTDLNLHIAIGAPSGVVDVNIILDGCAISASDTANGGLFAGNFAAGSKINLVLINNAQIQGKGGKGGLSGFSNATINEFPPPDYNISNGSASPGEAGGIAYDSNGIDTDIYLGGSYDSYTALGTIRAPGGGGGSQNGQGSGGTVQSGNSGGGGAGSNVGTGGAIGVTDDDGLGLTVVAGTVGSPGTTTGTGGAAGGTGAGAGGGWGVAGTSGNSAGGAAGKGLVKGGATVNIYTSGNTGRFTNGSGDTPDVLS